MGEVYEVLNRDDGSSLALKVLLSPTPDSLLRFKNEFRALQDIRHPYLVTLYELVEEDGIWFLTMELVAGVDFLRYARPTASEEPSAPQTTVTLDEGDHLSQAGGDRARADDTRCAPRFDEARLRSTLRQIAGALCALHAAGKVHRDVKPSNVLVTSAGRAVLFDFGLIVDLDVNPWLTADGQMVGTPAFMAPEQISGGRVGPEADWYALGSTLYAALTGQPPFRGKLREIFHYKQHGVPLAPSAIVSSVPEDLEALCLDLLQVHPATRPTGEEVVRRLNVQAKEEEAPSFNTATSFFTPFVGREMELALLEDAFIEVQAALDHAVVVQVHGESGVGKTALVRQFAKAMTVEQGALVLSSRCYESEVVPFKAIDGIMDTLTAFLAGLKGEDAAALLPLRASLLAQVFPVLRRVQTIARAPLPPKEGMDPQELRARAFAALRELLGRLSERRPLVLVIDDLQWTDRDSLTLLGEVLRQPDSPPLLLVATVRDVSGDLASTAAPLAELASDFRDVHLQPLPLQEARKLAALLLRSFDEGNELDPAAIAAESRGNPLFIDELVRHGAAGGGARSAPLALEDVLWERINALGEPASRILTLLAIAGTPMSETIIAQAASVSLGEFSLQLAQLRAAGLVHMTGMSGSDAIQCRHDRVRTAVVSHLDAEARRRGSFSLALALESTKDADAVALALHWHGAGDEDRALAYALKGAEAASEALAFDHAAELYESALASPHLAPADERLVAERLGDALVNAGRGIRAAAAYRRAARGAPTANALDLERRAADQLLRAGHFDEGLSAVRTVLSSIGLSLPETALEALIRFLVGRLVLWLRRLRFVRRDATEIAATELMRVDVCRSVSFGLGVVDPVRGAAFQVRALLLALRAGEVKRVAFALSSECVYVARHGGASFRRAMGLADRAQGLAEAAGDPHAIAYAHATRGVACYLNGRFTEARDLSGSAIEMFRGKCKGVAWELAVSQFFEANALAQLGELLRLAENLPRALRDAFERGDRYAAVCLRIGLTNLHWLAIDEAKEAEKQVREAMTEWSNEGFHLEHLYELLASVNIDLYVGRPREAYARVAARWEALRRSLLPFTTQSVRILSRYARARSAIAAVEDGDDVQLLRVAERDARVLARERAAWSLPLAKTVRASLAWREGAEGQALALLREAIAGFEAVDMKLHAAAARRRLSALVAGDAGRELERASNEWMASEKVKNPDRIAQVFIPGFTRRT